MLRLFFIINVLFFTVNIMADSKIEQPCQKFKSFTGKVTGNKVRLRISPDLDSHVITQLSKDELVLVKEDALDFWAIQPTINIKAYVFRSYIIGDQIEADKVNIRLQPNLEAPVIGQLKNKDKIKGEIYSQDNKWMEITLPENINFYIAKEYVTYAGNANCFASFQKRKSQVEDLLNSAYFITQSECKKPYDEMVPQEAIAKFDTIIKEYFEFPQHVQQAKEGLALLQDNYLQKKIAYLEAKANISHKEKNELANAIEQITNKDGDSENDTAFQETKKVTAKMKNWDSIEHSLFATWTTFHPEKTEKDFYKEQEINALTISGIIEGYSQSIKNKPGDYIVKQEDASKAYLYSTKINLDEFVGKKVTLSVSPRPNNNFAFPAYFVNSIEIK